jgi:hypothetical protein
MKKILILTPDGVGSTLLQRTACAWGNLTNVWINPHELTNGLVVKNGFLQKDRSLGYSQSLFEIVDLLFQERENLIGRVAQYHIVARKDSEKDLKYFYDFLNSDFEIISCHRRNVFEYAMSWAIRDIKKTLNVYSYKQKEQIHPPTDSFNLDPMYITKKLNDYSDYERWLNDNFSVKHHFYYEDVLLLDHFLELTIGGSVTDFIDRFGLSLGKYCLISNHSKDQIRYLDTETFKSMLSLRKYFNELVNLGRMPNTVPLKMNSFKSKIRKTINFTEILDAYNTWTKNKNDYQEINEDRLRELIERDPFNV